MKLDRHKLVELICYCANRGMEVNKVDIVIIDSLTEIEGEFSEPNKAIFDATAINELLRHMQEGASTIETIKAYRSLTGLGLKESKDAIEKYSRVKEKSVGYISSIILNYFNANDIHAEPNRQMEADKLALLLIAK